MVDKVTRADLADKLRLLFAGEMTNDEFDKEYHSRWWNAKDDAVREIAKFGWGLYSSDLLFPYRLTGSNTLPEKAIDTAKRATTFLATDKSYSWPTNVKGVTSFWGFFSPWNCTIFGIVLLLSLMNGYFLPCLALFVLLAICIFHYCLFTYQDRRAELDHFHASSDIEAWPFISKDEWQKAENHHEGIGFHNQATKTLSDV